MVVQGLIALALALPTGLLFGIGYGNGVRIGYEQVYPLLFPKDKDNRNVAPTVDNIKQINKIYDLIGGKEASQMGIANGLNAIRSETENNPDFLYLEELESKLSGRTPSNLDKHNQSEPTSDLDSESDSFLDDIPLDSSLNPDSPNFDAEYYILVKKAQGDNPQTPSVNYVGPEAKEALKLKTSTQIKVYWLNYIKKWKKKGDKLLELEATTLYGMTEKDYDLIKSNIKYFKIQVFGTSAPTKVHSLTVTKAGTGQFKSLFTGYLLPNKIKTYQNNLYHELKEFQKRYKIVLDNGWKVYHIKGTYKKSEVTRIKQILSEIK